MTIEIHASLCQPRNLAWNSRDRTDRVVKLSSNFFKLARSRLSVSAERLHMRYPHYRAVTCQLTCPSDWQLTGAQWLRRATPWPSRIGPWSLSGGEGPRVGCCSPKQCSYNREPRTITNARSLLVRIGLAIRVPARKRRRPDRKILSTAPRKAGNMMHR